MAGSSAELHEDESRLQAATIDRHRAIVSIMEELEAVDWYDQRADGTDEPELAEILRHNRDEEKEHAVMTLEWLRRHDPVLDQHLRHFLFTDGPILEAEEELTGTGPGATGSTPPSSSLGIGSMRAKEGL
ncbi:MAG TPA: ferritin-like domain-containing protein [Acidimicrobiales bacterium]|jgi:hypothetical protein